MKCLITLLAGAVFAVSAAASPITVPPPVINALGGDVTAIYIYSNASDSSSLSLVTPPPVNPIFCNAAITGTCASANNAGDAADLGIRHGILTFTLTNASTGDTYDSTHPDSDGNYHAWITANYADFGVGTLPSAAATALGSLTNVTFIGFEDRQLNNNGDWDYNDLIFAFSNTAPARNPGIPEPLTLSLVGAGLFAAFGLRRARKHSSVTAA